MMSFVSITYGNKNFLYEMLMDKSRLNRSIKRRSKTLPIYTKTKTRTTTTKKRRIQQRQQYQLRRQKNQKPCDLPKYKTYNTPSWFGKITKEPHSLFKLCMLYC